MESPLKFEEICFVVVMLKSRCCLFRRLPCFDLESLKDKRKTITFVG